MPEAATASVEEEKARAEAAKELEQACKEVVEECRAVAKVLVAKDTPGQSTRNPSCTNSHGRCSLFHTSPDREMRSKQHSERESTIRSQRW